MLHRKKSTSQITKLMVDVDSREIPMIIYRERRRSWRVALGQRSVNLRIPEGWQHGEAKIPIEWAIKWTKEKYRKQPELFDHFFLQAPNHGHVYKTLYGDYTVQIIPQQRQTATGKVVGRDLVIKLPASWKEEERAETLPKLISKVLASHFRAPFSARIAELNAHCFGFHYADVSFKYNKSNWGSCSHTGHLNFSTRLFLGPQSVADYVIIHELAHLKEHNHSDAFWKLVKLAMPQYELQVNWLKKYGSKLYF